MKKVYSNSEDCYNLSIYLKEKLGNSIDYLGTTYGGVVTGYYYLENADDYVGCYLHPDKNGLAFQYKYSEGNFLSIAVNSVGILYKHTKGEKLAAISAFYEALKERFDTPTVYFASKDNQEEVLNLYWSFDKKKEDITKFKNNSFFVDGTIVSELIVFNDPDAKQNKDGLHDITKKLIADGLGLPYEMLPIVNANIETYIKYKRTKGQIIDNEKPYQRRLIFDKHKNK